jgi:hypothetical protein
MSFGSSRCPVLDYIAHAMSDLRQVLPGDIDVTAAESVAVQGTGAAVVQLLYGGPWAQSVWNTAQNEVLRVNVWADVSRTDFGEPVKDDADYRAWAVYELIDGLLNDHDHRLRWVVTSYRRTGPTLTTIPNSDGGVLLSVDYETRR